MRIKALLCMAAFAASVIPSMAQVYSQNIVGYVNVTMPNAYGIYANPLDKDGVNSAGPGATGVFATIPDGATFLTWNGSSFTTYVFDSTLGIDPRNWYDASLNGVDAPLLPPGKGFFMNPGGAFTNTFVGNVVPAPGTTNSMAIANAANLIGSPMPVGGSIAAQGQGNLNIPLVDGMTLQVWTGSGYTTHLFDSTLGIDPGNWYDASLNALPPPNINVGSGFFYNPGAPTTWKQWY